MELLRLTSSLRRVRAARARSDAIAIEPSSVPRAFGRVTRYVPAVRTPLSGRARPVVPLAVGEPLKRSLDVTGAALGLLALSPLFLLIVAMVRFCDGGGPALYGHARIGRDGRPFRCLKFRTMVVDGDAVLARYLASDPSARREWDETRKLRHDPRVTPLGRVMRQLSIDELPQLINVLRGEMSLVGPRPVVREELDRYGRSASYYLRVRPGLTGLWQISGRSDTTYRRRVAYDRIYAQRYSLGTDIVIIARTIPAVCFARGSY